MRDAESFVNIATRVLKKIFSAVCDFNLQVTSLHYINNDTCSDVGMFCEHCHVSSKYIYTRKLFFFVVCDFNLNVTSLYYVNNDTCCLFICVTSERFVHIAT